MTQDEDATVQRAVGTPFERGVGPLTARLRQAGFLRVTHPHFSAVSDACDEAAQELERLHLALIDLDRKLMQRARHNTQREAGERSVHGPRHTGYGYGAASAYQLAAALVRKLAKRPND